MDSSIYRLKTYWASHRERINARNSPRLFQKTVLRCVTAHFSLLGAVLLGAAIKPWDEIFEHSKGVAGDWQDGLPLAPVWICSASFYVVLDLFPSLEALPPCDVVSF